MMSLAARGRCNGAGERVVTKPPKPCIKTFAVGKMVQICFANASLSFPPAPPHHSNGCVVVVEWGLPMLLTGILCVDECAGLTAQCAYLIGAAPLSGRVSPSLSPSLTSFQSLFCWRCQARAFHSATRCSLPTLFLKG